MREGLEVKCAQSLRSIQARNSTCMWGEKPPSAETMYPGDGMEGVMPPPALLQEEGVAPRIFELSVVRGMIPPASKVA